jgi:hypothetical protein
MHFFGSFSDFLFIVLEMFRTTVYEALRSSAIPYFLTNPMAWNLLSFRASYGRTLFETRPAHNPRIFFVLPCSNFRRFAWQ